MKFPDKTYPLWILRALLQCLGCGVVIGGLWSLVYSDIARIAVSQGTEIGGILSYLIDPLMIYAVVSFSTMIALSMYRVQDVAEVVFAAQRYLLKGLLLTLVISMSLMVLFQAMRLDPGFVGIDSFQRMLFLYAASAAVGYHFGYRSHVLWGVMSTKERNQTINKWESKPKPIKFLRVISGTRGYRDKSRPTMSVLIGIFSIVIALQFGTELAVMIGNERWGLLGTAIGLGFFMWLVATIVRLWDLVRPFGLPRESLALKSDPYRIH